MRKDMKRLMQFLYIKVSTNDDLYCLKIIHTD